MARAAPSISPGIGRVAPPPAPVALRRNDRSLGFLPLLLMSLIYVILNVFQDAIGPITSDPGFYQLTMGPPNRGCIIPRASP